MTPQVIMGMVVSLGLSIFLGYVLIKRPELASNPIARLFASLLAGAAAAWLSGEIAVNFDQEIKQGMKIVIQATAGMGLFVLVWTTFGKIGKEAGGVGFNVSFPANLTFKMAAVMVAKGADSTVEFRGFSEAEKALPVQETTVCGKDPADVLKRLVHITEGQITKYRVTRENNHFILEAAN